MSSSCSAADANADVDPRTNEERRWRLTPAKLLGPQWRAYSPDMGKPPPKGATQDDPPPYVSAEGGDIWPGTLPARLRVFSSAWLGKTLSAEGRGRAGRRLLNAVAPPWWAAMWLRSREGL